VSPRVAVGALGVDGTVAGVTDADGSDVEEPKALDAVTVNVYAVPLLNPVTTSGELDPVAVKLPGEEVAVYEIVPVPRTAGAVKATLTCVLPAVPTTEVGAPGFIPAPKPNLRVAPLPMRFMKGMDTLMQILID
jgi:hypothetical protein